MTSGRFSFRWLKKIIIQEQIFTSAVYYTHINVDVSILNINLFADFFHQLLSLGMNKNTDRDE